MISLALAQNVQSEANFGRFALFLDPEQSPFQIQPERDFLKSRSRSRISVQFRHFLNLANPTVYSALKLVQEVRVFRLIVEEG